VPAASAATCALLSVGTVMQSKAALDVAAGAIGEFEFGQRGEQSRGGASLLVGMCGDVGPEGRDGRQAGFAEHQRMAGRIGGAGGVHAVALAARRAS